MSILLEYANYKPNQLVNSEVARKITGYNIRYRVNITDKSGVGILDKSGSDPTINVYMNDDDITTEESDNSIFSYLDSSKIEFVIDDLNKYISNYEEVAKSLKFIPNDNSKIWKSDTLLYLIKINKNSGVIGRYDAITDKFRTHELSWNSSDPEAIIRDVLTPEYMNEYLSTVLNTLYTPLDFKLVK